MPDIFDQISGTGPQPKLKSKGDIFDTVAGSPSMTGDIFDQIQPDKKKSGKLKTTGGVIKDIAIAPYKMMLGPLNALPKPKIVEDFLTPTRVSDQPNLYDDVIMKTQEGVPRVTSTLAGGAAAFPASGLYGLGAGTVDVIKSDIVEVKKSDNKLKAGAKKYLERLNPVGTLKDIVSSEGAAKGAEKVGELSMKAIKTPEELEAVKTIMKPMEWVSKAGEVYGDWTYKTALENGVDEKMAADMAAVVRSAPEIAAYVALPELKLKLMEAIKTRNIAKIKDIRLETENAWLEQEKTTKSGFGKLVEAEKKMKVESRHQRGEFTPEEQARINEGKTTYLKKPKPVEAEKPKLVYEADWMKKKAEKVGRIVEPDKAEVFDTAENLKKIEAGKIEKSDITFSNNEEFKAYAKSIKDPEILQRLAIERNEAANVDAMTGVGSANKLWNRINNGELKENVISFDLDGLKTANDYYGQNVGDSLIKGLGKALLENDKTGDRTYRLGGDDFFADFDTVPEAKKFIKNVKTYLDKNPAVVILEDGRKGTFPIKFTEAIGRGKDEAFAATKAKKIKLQNEGTKPGRLATEYPGVLIEPARGSETGTVRGYVPKEERQVRKSEVGTLKKPTEKTPEISAPDTVKGTDLEKFFDTSKLENKPTVKAPEPKGKSKTLYGGLPVHEVANLYTNKIGSLIWDKFVMKKLPKILERVPGGKALNRALIYDYRGSLPKTGEYMGSLEISKRRASLGLDYGIDLGNRLSELPENSKLKVAEYIKGNEGVKLSPEELKLADESKNAFIALGKRAAELGLLNKETFFKNVGKYMPRLYTSKEYAGLLTQFKEKKPTRLDLSRFKQRKDIPKEIREQMGEILTPEYPVAKGISQLTHDIAVAEFFDGISKNPDWAMIPTEKVIGKNKNGRLKIKSEFKGEIPDGWQQLPSNKKLGTLSEAYVHPEIYADLNQAIRVMSKGEKFWRKTLGSWKFGKVILSPKTHARNLMSNSILAHLGGLPMYEQPIFLFKAVSEMRGRGKYWDMAKNEGLLDTTFTNAELRELFDKVDSQMKGIKAESMAEKLGVIGSAWEKIKSGGRKAAKLYEAEEQWFKMAKFIHNIERRGMDPKAAAMDAEKWLFNYSKLTRFQENYRSKWYGAPFATFTFKAMPRLAEAAIKTPHRFILPAMMIYALEQAAMNKIGDDPETFKAKKELRPEWMKGHVAGMPNFARVPVVDEYGREHYVNLTYIMPWGDLGESGGKFGIPGGLMPLSQPFVKEPYQLITNYDQFWQENIIKDKDLAGKEGLEKYKTIASIAGKHIFQSLAPTPAMDIMKGYAAFKGQPDYRGRERKRAVVAADVFLGIKMYPVDYAEQVHRIISEKNPQTGEIARQIIYDIKTLNVKRNAMKKKGRDTSQYDKQIDEKIKQLMGLAKEVQKIGKTYGKIKQPGKIKNENPLGGNVL